MSHVNLWKVRQVMLRLISVYLAGSISVSLGEAHAGSTGPCGNRLVADCCRHRVLPRPGQPGPHSGPWVCKAWSALQANHRFRYYCLLLGARLSRMLQMGNWVCLAGKHMKQRDELRFCSCSQNIKYTNFVCVMLYVIPLCGAICHTFRSPMRPCRAFDIPSETL